MKNFHDKYNVHYKNMHVTIVTNYFQQILLSLTPAVEKGFYMWLRIAHKIQTLHKQRYMECFYPYFGIDHSVFFYEFSVLQVFQGKS